jgi:hypothetical protein
VIEHHPAEPWPEWPRGVERVDPRQRRHELLLNCILRVFAMLKDVIGNAERRAHVLVHQPRERSDVARPNALY